MEILVSHEWVQNIISRRKVKVLEICGGTGIGGIALAKVLVSKGVDVDLLTTDLRGSALEIAKKWSREVLGRDIRVEVIDAREVHKLGERFDLSLMYGLSTPHFDPWDFIKVIASVCEVLDDDGIFVVDEGDRRYSIFITQGYKWSLAEAYNEEGKVKRMVVSYHVGYDPIRGVCRRAFVDYINPRNIMVMDMFFWSIAETSSLLWLFFEDVDAVNIKPNYYFILGYRPRRKLKMEHLSTLPKILTERR